VCCFNICKDNDIRFNVTFYLDYPLKMEHIEFIDNDGIRRVALPFDENRVNLVSCNFMDGAAEVVENGDLFYVVAIQNPAIIGIDGEKSTTMRSSVAVSSNMHINWVSVSLI